MEKYNYREAVKADVLDYIKENISFADFATIDELSDKLNEDLWTEDSVTGNASGSYTFSTWKAEENLCHNFDLIEETAEAFGIEATISCGWEHGAEWWDVNIRCYLLGEAIAEALEAIKDEFDKCHEVKPLRVCWRCKMAIESHEGTQTALIVYPDENDPIDSFCDWCEESGFDMLYEL